MKDLENFVKTHIAEFNEHPRAFKKSEFNETQIKNYLKNRLARFCESVDSRAQILKAFAAKKYKKNKIGELANEFCLYKLDVERFLECEIFMEFALQIDLSDLKGQNLKYIECRVEDKNKFAFIKNKFSKILEKSLFLASMDGFRVNLLGLNTGVMVANAGDSAEFLFIARAILAGFNASSVDVRSARYDTIIDFDGVLLRVQVKGIGAGEFISFKDRDRGGQGIDHTHESNRGKRITGADCDIYVAVDKQVGLCYLIPMSFADGLADEECVRVPLTRLERYKENWELIKEVAKQK